MTDNPPAATIWLVTDERRTALCVALTALAHRRAAARVYLSWPEVRERAQQNLALLDASEAALRAMLDDAEREDVLAELGRGGR